MAGCNTPSALAWASPKTECYFLSLIWEEGPGHRSEGKRKKSSRGCVAKLVTKGTNAWREILLGRLKSWNRASER